MVCRMVCRSMRYLIRQFFALPITKETTQNSVLKHMRKVLLCSIFVRGRKAPAALEVDKQEEVGVCGKCRTLPPPPNIRDPREKKRHIPGLGTLSTFGWDI